jgi:hypothetical protein
MVDTQDIWRKKSSGGFVSENPLSSAQARAANPLSSARPHASSASTVAKPQSSAPPNASTVSLRQGDTLWEVAQKKLGDGTRWHELHKADGSRFTGQEVKHLQVGTQVYLPGAKPTTKTYHPGNSSVATPNVPAQVFRTGGVTRRELTASTVLTKSTQPSALPVSRKSQIASQQIVTQGITRRDRPNGYNHLSLNTQSRDSLDSKNNALLNGTVKGTAVGITVANRNLSPLLPSQAKDALKLVKKGGIGKAELEARLKASGWVEVRGRWAKKSKPTSPMSTIWTNPSREESIRITPKKGGSFGVRGYDGPSGGAVNNLRQDPKNHTWKSQGRKGEKPKPLLQEHPLDIRGRKGSKPTHTYSDSNPREAKRTHFKLKPESRGVVKALENSHVRGVARGASKVLAPVAVGLDAWQLKNAYQKDGFGSEFRKEAGRVAGGWGGAAAGAAGGAAIGSVVPVVGTAAGAIVGGVIGGVAGSEFGDDIEQGAEKAGKAIAGGAKKAWNKLFG